MDSQALLLSFVAAGRRLALPLKDIQRVVPMPLLEPAVGVPPFLEGFFDFRGVPVAAIRLDRLMKLEEERLGVYSPLLVLKGHGPAIALHVTSASSILRVNDAEIQPIGRNETFNACVVARVTDREGTIYLLSREQILLAEERNRLAAYQKIKDQRVETLAGPAEAAESLAHVS